MKRFLFLAAIFISIISFSQTTSYIPKDISALLTSSANTNEWKIIAGNNRSTFSLYSSYTSDQTITVQQGNYKTGTISANDGDGVINIQSIAATYQPALVSVGTDPSDPTNPLKFRITGVAQGNSVVTITWKNSQNQQMTYTTTVTVTPPPPTTSITVTYN